MTATTPDHRTVFAAVELANRAPSVRDAQPWRWLVGNRSVHLMADHARRLSATDLLLSCGAALHHLRVAFAALGWETVVHRIPNEHDLDHLAAVEPHPGVPTDVALAGAITRRRPDRRRFTSWEVPADHLDLLTRTAANAGARLAPVADDDELLVLSPLGDDPLSVLRAGEAASATLLTATDLGLATCPLSPPLGDHVLDPHLVLRVGWAPASAPTLPPSPVRRTEDTVDYLPGIHH